MLDLSSLVELKPTFFMDEFSFFESSLFIEVKTARPWIFNASTSLFSHLAVERKQTQLRLPYIAFAPEEMLARDFFGPKEDPLFS